MIKRPLNAQFSNAVLEKRKITTIREKPWPVGVPIMLYNWSGAAYRSPQIDVGAVIVREWWPITIARTSAGDMRYVYRMDGHLALHETEGFESRAAMDEWFRPLVKNGQSVTKHLMRFRLANV
jgi:hypothetical protein